MSNPIGIYLHIPFCMSKCPYCDFYSLPYCEQNAQQYVGALLHALDTAPGKGREVDSIYFGGGTPVLLGGAVATFFTGSEFYIDKGNMTNTVMPVISHWANGWHGLDALANPWNVVLGLAVFFLARILGALYFINNIDDKDLVARSRRSLIGNSVLFLVFFLSFVIRTLLADGYAVNPETGEVFMEPYKYLTNFIEMPLVLVLFLIGVVLVLFGIGKS